MVEIISNDAQIIQEDLGNLLNNGFQTIVIILILLIVFLGWREALLASLSVPLTMLMTLIFLNQFGYTINFLTLFSLILALGILVDSSIVIVEGIHGYLLQGKTSREAAVLAIREFKLPLAAGTFTTISVLS